jgi:glutamine amidotransferase
MAMHNGYIENFRFTLMRQIRESLRDEYYTAIGGSTDSEHIFALFLNYLHGQVVTLENIIGALHETLSRLAGWAEELDIRVALNLAVTDGDYIVASRFSNKGPAPSLYFVKNAGLFAAAAAIASERLWLGEEWVEIAESSIVGFDTSLDLHDYRLEWSATA